MRRLFLSVLILALLIGASVSAEKLTLDDCIRMALETDPTVNRARNSVSTANATVRNQMGQFLPSLSFGYNASERKNGPLRRTVDIGQGVVISQVTNTSIISKNYSAGFSANYNIFDGLQNLWNYKGSKASLEKASHEYLSNKSDMAFNVKTNYYLVLKAIKDLDVALDAIKRSEELLKLFQEKYELGSASLSEVLKQKVQFGNDKLTKVRAEKVLEIRYDNLAVDIGLDPVERFEIANIELSQENVDDIGKLIASSLEFHPVVQASKAGVNSFKYDVRSSWGRYMPTVTFGYQYGWGNDQATKLFDDMSDFNKFNYAGSWQLSIGFNLFDRFSRERNLNRAKVGLNNARSQYNYNRNWVIKQLQDAYLGIKLAEETISVTTETEGAASEDMELVQAKYNLGSAALWELLDAQVSLKEAQFNKVKSEFDYNLALARLKNAMGEY